MDILVMGGTAFLGRQAVELALDRGHRVTTFNRGLTGDDHPHVEALHGDRDDLRDLAQLDGRSFDAVIDTSGFVPQVVGRTIAALGSRVGHYCFVSSCSASVDWPERPVIDASPTYECPPDAGPEDGDYGTLKAGCERAVRDAYADRALLVRAGLLVGPYENVGRLPWWLQRIARGGDVLAPGDPATPMQLVDARDLAAWMLDCAEQGVGGSFHATGPRGNATMGGWLRDCVATTGSGARLVWVDDEALLAHEVEPWSELPLWMPKGQGADHAWDVDTSRAEAAGLRTRALAETVADTWAWLQREQPSPPRLELPPIGIDPAKERRILTAIARRSSAV